MTDRQIPPRALIAAAINERNWIQAQAAEALGIADSSMSRLLHGEIGLSIELALRCEKLLGLNARMLMIRQLDCDLADARENPETPPIDRRNGSRKPRPAGGR